MTGYGEGVRSMPTGASVSVRIKSINGKSLRLVTRLPEAVAPYEKEIEALIRKSISRGTIELVADVQLPSTDIWRIDEKLLHHYRTVARRISGEDVKVSELLGLPGVIRRDEARLVPRLKRLFIGAVSDALKLLLASRRREGTALAKQIKEQLRVLKRKLMSLKNECSRSKMKISKQNLAQLKALFKDKTAGIDDSAPLREAILAMEKSDISEEVERLNIHISEFEKMLKVGKAVGLRLDFLAQEMHREASTIASKYPSASSSVDVVDVRTLIAAIRQQVQNIE